MDIQQIRDVLLWCSIINIGVLIFWFAMVSCAGDWVYRCHNRFIELPRERFNSIHYQGLGLFKIAVFFFNVIPYIALLIVCGK